MFLHNEALFFYTLAPYLFTLQLDERIGNTLGNGTRNFVMPDRFSYPEENDRLNRELNKRIVKEIKEIISVFFNVQIPGTKIKILFRRLLVVPISY